jgi:hypothetical protein
MQTEPATAIKTEPASTPEADAVAITLKPLQASIKELMALHQRMVNAREAYANLVDAVADKTKLKPAVIRSFIAAKMSETGARRVVVARQLAMVFDEVGI